jgi:hypothetical protein
MGRLNCSVVNMCHKQLIKRVLETSRGCPWDGQDETNKIKNKKKY